MPKNMTSFEPSLAEVQYITDNIRDCKAYKVSGPVEHWLTTWATGIWGYEHERVRNALSPGDVVIFQANKYSSENKLVAVPVDPSEKVIFKSSGFIGLGIVDSFSNKNQPLWLSEHLYAKKVKVAGEKVWPYLVHFSKTFWFGELDGFDPNNIQQIIDRASEIGVDLVDPMVGMLRNVISNPEMDQLNFKYAPPANGSKIVSPGNEANAAILAEIIYQRLKSAKKSHAVAVLNFEPEPALEPEPKAAWRCIQISSPKPRAAKSSATVVKTSGSKINYLEKAESNQEIGESGELRVLELERNFVEEKYGKLALARVSHVSKLEGDGLGYDIRSVREKDGVLVDHFIEVKTTTSSGSTPFYISANELAFVEKNSKNYTLVRVCKLNDKKKTCEYFEFCGDELLSLERRAESYRVFPG